MGARNAIAALGLGAGKLPEHTRLVLVAMALRSLDQTYGHNRPRLYFAGQADICTALGEVPTASALRRVQRDIARLVAAGYIERVGTVHRHACHRLHLPVDNSGRTDGSGAGFG